MTDIWDRARGGVFGEATEDYETGRPGFIEELIEHIVDYAGRPRRALEIGAGTGKATVGFAPRVGELVCVEPDARMAAVLRSNTEQFPGVSIAISTFEDFQNPGEPFDLLFAARSWHWTDRDRRWTLAREVLRPGGAFAIFWNGFHVPQGGLNEALAAVHTRHDAEELGKHTLLEIQDDDPTTTAYHQELSADDRFTDLEFLHYRHSHAFDTARFVALLASYSGYRIMPDGKRTALLADVAATVDEHGGRFESASHTVAILGRAR